MRFLAAALLVPALSCSDSLGPLVEGKPYMLAAVNGQSLPQSIPGVIVPVTSGWIKLHSDSSGERFEHYSDGVIIDGWTAVGRTTLRNGLLILEYRPGEVGPRNPVDTFYVSDTGLVLRERGYGAPVDSLVRYYQRP